LTNCLSSYIEFISENILDTRFENFAQSTLDNVKSRIVDVIGCLISGAHTPGNLALVDLIKTWGGKEEATILVHGGKVPAHNAAMVNTMMARSFDFEPVGAFVEGVDIPSHISGTTVIAALNLGEMKEVSGKELITALLVGDDLACRILAASGFGFSEGWDNTGTVNAFGSAAIAGRLLGLTKKQIQNTFGIVLNQLGGSLQNILDGTLCFRLPQGLSARNGIIAAELAKAGWNGPQDALLSTFGYYYFYTDDCVYPEILLKDLGKKYYTEATFKPYPCCRATHSAIDCALSIVDKYKIEISKIEKITLKVPSWVREMFVSRPFHIREFPQVDAAFNIRFCVANALIRENVALEHFDENLIKDPQILSVVDKIVIEECEEDTQKKFKANLELKMKDGSKISSKIDFPKGDPVHSPLSKEEIKKKFMNNVVYSQTVPRDNAEKLIELIDNLEKVSRVNELVELLVI